MMFEKNPDGSWNSDGVSLNVEILNLTGNRKDSSEYLHIRSILDTDSIMRNLLLGLHAYWYEKWNFGVNEYYRKYMDATNNNLDLMSQISKLNRVA